MRWVKIGLEMYTACGPDAVREIAAAAMRKGTGARALRGILEKLMLERMFEIPENPDIAGVTVTGAAAKRLRVKMPAAATKFAWRADDGLLAVGTAKGQVFVFKTA